MKIEFPGQRRQFLFQLSEIGGGKVTDAHEDAIRRVQEKVAEIAGGDLRLECHAARNRPGILQGQFQVG